MNPVGRHLRTVEAAVGRRRHHRGAGVGRRDRTIVVLCLRREVHLVVGMKNLVQTLLVTSI
ncbi:hypothetical protein BH23CHL5_BH23CHL5_12340 [soil metagenome]